MGRELNEQNAKEAYCTVLAATGIGGAVNNCDDVLPQIVWVVVPADMHEDYPARLLAAAIQICTDEPYEWTVENVEPEIDEESSFQSVYDEWFTLILYD
jgi:hypothetical protein